MAGYLDLNDEQRRRFIRLQNTDYANSPNEIACPYCNEKQNLDFEDVSYRDDDTNEHECYDCGKKFDVHTSVEYSWRTEVPDEEVVEMVLKESEEKEQ